MPSVRVPDSGATAPDATDVAARDPIRLAPLRRISLIRQCSLSRPRGEAQRIKADNRRAELSPVASAVPSSAVPSSAPRLGVSERRAARSVVASRCGVALRRCVGRCMARVTR